MLHPRLARAPQYRSRSPRRLSAPGRLPPPEPFSEPLRKSSFKSHTRPASTGKDVRAVVSVPGLALGELLGPSGRTLKTACRRTGARVMLRPDMDCDKDGYVADVAGNEAAVTATKEWLLGLVALAVSVAAQEGLEPQLGEHHRQFAPPGLDETLFQVRDEDFAPISENLEGQAQLRARISPRFTAPGFQELKRTENIEFPSDKNEAVLQMRAPGWAGVTTGEALRNLKERFALDELRFLTGEERRIEGSSPCASVLRAFGDASKVEGLVAEIAQRLAQLEHFLVELLPVDAPHAVVYDTYAGAGEAKLRIEAACCVYLSARKLGINEHGSVLSSVCIRGTAAAIEKAKPMILEQLSVVSAKAPGISAAASAFGARGHPDAAIKDGRIVIDEKQRDAEFPSETAVHAQLAPIRLKTLDPETQARVEANAARHRERMGLRPRVF